MSPASGAVSAVRESVIRLDRNNRAADRVQRLCRVSPTQTEDGMNRRCAATSSPPPRSPEVPAFSLFFPLSFSFSFLTAFPQTAPSKKKKKNVSDHTEQLEHAGEVCEVSAGRHCRLCLAKACQQIFQHFSHVCQKRNSQTKLFPPWLKKNPCKTREFHTLSCPSFNVNSKGSMWIESVTRIFRSQPPNKMCFGDRLTNILSSKSEKKNCM